MATNGDILILQSQDDVQRAIHYEVNPKELPLGEGGTGIVRHGVMVDKKSGVRKDVAIKFLYSDLTENVIQRSKREAEIHIVHENLVEMLDFVQVGNSDLYGNGSVHYHVVSELLCGVMLLDLLNSAVPDDIYEKYPKIKEFNELLLNDRVSFALTIIRGVLSGIMALHDNGYIHRDIDPSNIMITHEGKIKLIDLGICKRLGNMNNTNENLTSVGQFVGKASYAAPELVRGDLANQNETTDIYAIGIMLYQIILGKLPFQGSMNEVLDKQITSKMPVKNIQNKQIRELVKKATEKKQEDRYQTAAEFRVAIDSIQYGDEIVDKELPIVPLTVAAVVVGAIVGIGLAFLI